MREHVVVRHPLQTVDERNFAPGALGAPGPFSFDALTQEAALRARDGEPERAPFLSAPLPAATDDHQRLNAKALVDAGAAMSILEDDLTVDRLSEAIQTMLEDGQALERRAAAARSVGIPDAAERLADLVESVATGRP